MESKSEVESKFDDKTPSESKPKKGRRERVDDASSDADASSIAMPKSNDAFEETAPKPRRRPQTDTIDGGVTSGSGWMTATNKSPVERNMMEEDSISPMKEKNKEKFFQENNEDIMLIPELDEDGNDEDHRVAHAPKNISRRLPTLLELEEDALLQGSAVLFSEGDIDLGPLVRGLVPWDRLQEENFEAIWTFDSLLREISDELGSTPNIIINGPINSNSTTFTSSGGGASMSGKHRISVREENTRASRKQ